MFNTISTKRGMTMIEVLIALFLLGVGILALISLQPSAWRLSGKSDYLGRGSGILAAQLQAMEAKIINPKTGMPTSDISPVSVYVSGQSTTLEHGDMQFWVRRTIKAGPVANTWLVNVVVTWPGNAAGIRESMIVARQQSFSQSFSQ